MSRKYVIKRRFCAWLIVLSFLTLTGEFCSRYAVADQINGRPVMMLSAELEDPSQKNKADKPIDASTWVREIFRQHILMVAREEFGFVTRDVTLGEPVHRDSPECFHLKVLVWEDTPVELTLRRGDQVLYEGTVLNPECHPLKKFRHLPKNALETRAPIVAALKLAGYVQKPLPKADPQALPQDVETLLTRMNTISQYAAVRRLHQLMQERGASPAILGGLVRGYAHLSQLTEPLLDLRHRAFGARSLLYAHRLVAQAPEANFGYWHRAYAFTFLGYPLGAQKELNAAKKHAKDNPTEPQWLKLIPLFVEYKFKDFEQLVEDEKYEYRETASLLWFMASRMTASPAFTIETGLKVRKVIPNSQRVIAGMFDTAGVVMNHQLSLEGAPALRATILKHFTDISDLPESVSTQLRLKTGNGQKATLLDTQPLTRKSYSLQEDTARLLRSAGEQDQQEPSFHVLESTLHAWKLQHLCQRAHFLRGYLGMDADDFVASTRSLVKDDPYGPLYVALGYSNYTPAEKALEFTQDISHVELNYCSIGYTALQGLPGTSKTKNGTVYEYLTSSWRDAGDFEETFRKRINGYYDAESKGERLKQVIWLDNVCVNSPMYYSEQVLLDWANVADKAEKWADQFPGYPCLQFSLARACKSFGDIDLAIKHYNQYLAIVRDARGYVGLAEATYMKDRKSDKWISVIENVMECEDYFLTHAQAAQRTASTLMHDGRFEDALPWAERAAESGSTLGMLSYVDALTGTGNFVQAEIVCRQTSQRYQSGDWYQWCVETGNGDLDAAWEFEQERLTQRFLPGDANAGLIKALHAAMTDNNVQALDLLLGMSKNRPPGEQPYVWSDTFAYLISDREGKKETCQQILQSYREQTEPPPHVKLFAAMLTLLDETDDEKPIDPEKFKALVDEQEAFSGDAWYSDLVLFAGYFDWTHGRQQKAIEQWTISARAADGRNRMLAWKWLREAGVDPIHIEDREFPDTFLRKRYELPKKKE